MDGINDLRRTARSLLSRAGVRPDVAERVLGHAVGSNIESIYDRHDWVAEKGDALNKLADLIERIVELPDGTNVVKLRPERTMAQG